MLNVGPASQAPAAAQSVGLVDREYKYSHTIGQNEISGPGFKIPVDLALGKDGIIYVLNRGFEEIPVGRQALRVTMLTIDEEYEGQFGGYGKGEGQLMRPTSIAVDSHQKIYISDELLQCITVFDKKGRFLDRWGSVGAGKGQLNRPAGLSVDPKDNLYVTDGFNHRVQIFTGAGQLLGLFGGFGTGDGQFNMPWGITTDQDGNVYVADWRNDRVQKFSPEGQFLAKFGSAGTLPGQFNRPCHVAVDRDRDVYVVDWLNHLVQVFTPEFKYLTAFTGNATMSKWGEQKLRANPGHLRMYGLITDWTPWQKLRFPLAMDVDGDGRVIILDHAANRLQVYQKGIVQA